MLAPPFVRQSIGDPPGRAGSARRPGLAAPAGGGHDVKVSDETPDVAPEPQAVLAPLTAAAIFLVVVMGPGDASTARVRGVCADVPALVRSVGFRDPEGHLTCVVGLGSQAWDRLGGRPRPAGLHPFREIRAGSRHAVATSGDVLFHIRAERMDLCSSSRPRS